MTTITNYIFSNNENVINLTGHPINVATGRGVTTIPTAKCESGYTWSLRVTQTMSDPEMTIANGDSEITVFGATRSTGLSLFCKETKESIDIGSIPTTVHIVVSAMVGSALPSRTALLPMTAPHENPTRNEKGWITSVKGLRFN